MKRAFFLGFDVPTRWLMDIADTIIGNRGHVVIGSVLAAYFVVFGLIDAKSTQEETRASLERSLFVTLVSSGNPASFVAAMKDDFGPMQTMRATEHPTWFRFWDWGRTYQPNREPMRSWAVERLHLCNKEIKDCSLDQKTRLELNFINLHNADLSTIVSRTTRPDFQSWLMSPADLSDADLYGADLSGADLSGADLRGANLHWADLFGANLRGADLRHADIDSSSLPEADLRRASYDQDTKFPRGFDPDKAGMIHTTAP